MQIIEVNSSNINYVLYEHFLLTDFIEAIDKDKFYKSQIDMNKKFKRIQLFV